MKTGRWITGLSEISDGYDGFIFDIWGTIYEGAAAFPGALDCLSALHQAGKKIAVLSNSPQLPHVVEKRLDGLGIAADLRDIVMTSGAETRAFLETRRDGFYQALGNKVYDTGPTRCPDLLTDLTFEPVADIEAADFILNSGPNKLEDTVADYKQTLDRAASLNLPMICANPDLEVLSNGTRLVCAGRLAEYYEGIGGKVRYHGKPHGGVFETTLSQLGTDIANTIMIGDNLATDIAGSNHLGLDCLMLTDGIHKAEIGPYGDSASGLAAVSALEHRFNVSSTWVAKRLAW